MSLDQQRNAFLANVDYQELALALQGPAGIVHSTYAIEGFAFAKRLDLFSVVEPGEGALFVDVGMEELCGHGHIDAVLRSVGLSDAAPDDPRWKNTAAFITHFHDDHDKNLDILVERGLRVAYHGPVVAYTPKRRDAFVRMCGAKREGDARIEEPVAFLMGAERHSDQVRAILRQAQQGQVLRWAGFEWEVLYTPGHTLEHACLLERERKMLFAGDHVLRAAPGLMQLDPDVHLLVRYLDSIEMLDALGLERVFMCHADTIKGPAAVHDALEALRASYVRPIRLTLNLMRAAATPGGYRAHNALLRRGSLEASIHSKDAFVSCQGNDSFVLVEVAPLYGEALDEATCSGSGDGWLTAYDAAKAYYAYLNGGFLGQLDLQRARRVATVFAYLEYLYDVGQLNRRTAHDGAFEYRIRHVE